MLDVGESRRGRFSLAILCGWDETGHRGADNLPAATVARWCCFKRKKTPVYQKAEACRRFFPGPYWLSASRSIDVREGKGILDAPLLSRNRMGLNPGDTKNHTQRSVHEEKGEDAGGENRPRARIPVRR